MPTNRFTDQALGARRLTMTQLGRMAGLRYQELDEPVRAGLFTVLPHTPGSGNRREFDAATTGFAARVYGLLRRRKAEPASRTAATRLLLSVEVPAELRRGPRYLVVGGGAAAILDANAMHARLAEPVHVIDLAAAWSDYLAALAAITEDALQEAAGR